LNACHAGEGGCGAPARWRRQFHLRVKLSQSTLYFATTRHTDRACAAIHPDGGTRALNRARRNVTSALISASDNCWPKAGMERPSAPVGGLMPLRITSATLSGAGA